MILNPTHEASRPWKVSPPLLHFYLLEVQAEAVTMDRCWQEHCQCRMQEHSSQCNTRKSGGLYIIVCSIWLLETFYKDKLETTASSTQSLDDGVQKKQPVYINE